MSEEQAKAKQIISDYRREKSNQMNFRSLWQETADFCFPRDSKIQRRYADGQEINTYHYDAEPIFSSIEAASGFSSAMMPAGQQFFSLKSQNRELNNSDPVRRWFSMLTEVVHDKIYESNFVMQMHESIRSIIVFGNACLYTEPDGQGVNFKDYDIGTYQFKENNKGNVDTLFVQFEWTARQCVQEWGIENVGEKIRQAYESEENREKLIEILMSVYPRVDRDPGRSDKSNKPFELSYISIEDSHLISDSDGFDEFPFAVGRWMKSSAEKYGRGQGTEGLPTIRVLNRMMQDFMEVSNKHAQPPLEVLESFEGDIDIRPGGINDVVENGSIRAVDMGTYGNYNITKDVLEMWHELVRRIFYVDIFNQLSQLTGDRRTTLEISERLREGLRRLNLPVARVERELFSPSIERATNIILRNNRWLENSMPPELREQPGFTIEYVGPLSLALQSQQVRGAQEWLFTLSELSEIYPEALDIPDIDNIIRDMGHALGAKVEHIKSQDVVDQVRQARMDQQAALQGQESMQAMSDMYSKTTKAPEDGSGAQAALENLGG